MTLADLIQNCRAEKTVTLTLRRQPTGEKIRLCGRKGPLGKVICCQVGEGGHTVARFDSAAVLKFLKAEQPELFV